MAKYKVVLEVDCDHTLEELNQTLGDLLATQAKEKPDKTFTARILASAKTHSSRESAEG